MGKKGRDRSRDSARKGRQAVSADDVAGDGAHDERRGEEEVEVDEAPPQPGTMAMRADRHECYESAVQSCAAELKNFEYIYHAMRGTRSPPPRVFREDFCGTALACRKWIERDVWRTAYGVDNDAAVLQWARERNALSDRVHLVHSDVMAVPESAQVPLADILCATNYSIGYFHDRARLIAYLRRARAAVAPGGVFIADMFGGAGNLQASRRTNALRGFKYICETAEADRLTNVVRMRLHFRFADGSSLSNAFTYAFRAWSVPEVLEALRDAGFERADVWIADRDPATGEFTSDFERRPAARGGESWCAYFVGAVPPPPAAAADIAPDDDDDPLA